MGLHSQTTRLYEYGPSSRCFRFPGPTGLSPSLACRSKSTSGSQAVDRDSPPLQTTIRPAVTIASREISDLGIFPLRSPLLRESLLVSLPPLIDMLKFSGWVSLDLRPQNNSHPNDQQTLWSQGKATTNLAGSSRQQSESQPRRRHSKRTQSPHTR